MMRIVRAAALAAVADRLEDGHADVPGLVLDRVDDRLHPLPDHDRFDFHHVHRLPSGPRKKPQEQRS